MARYLLVVLTNAAEGRDDEFNAWYSGQHLRDVVAIPGIVSATRYRLAPLQRAQAQSPYGYFALYEIETDDLSEVIAELNARSGTTAMTISDAMNAERFAYFFEPIGETLSKASPA